MAASPRDAVILGAVHGVLRAVSRDACPPALAHLGLGRCGGSVVAWLPDWLVDGKGWFIQLIVAWFIQLIVAWFICMIPWSVSMSVLSAIIKALIRRKSGR